MHTHTLIQHEHPVEQHNLKPKPKQTSLSCQPQVIPL